MNYNSESGLWESGALTFDPESFVARSYDWVFLKRFGSYLVLNMYKKSNTTTKHQNQVKVWLDKNTGPNSYEIVHSDASLTDEVWSVMAKAYYQGKLDQLSSKARRNMKDLVLSQYYISQMALVDHVVQAPRLRLVD